MLLNVYIEDRHYPLDVSGQLLSDAGDFFARMDADMDRGWQMSRQWVEMPSDEERCQIVADRLMAALLADNPQMVSMMAAYVLKKFPGIKGLRIDSSGEMQETELIFGAQG